MKYLCKENYDRFEKGELYNGEGDVGTGYIEVEVGTMRYTFRTSVFALYFYTVDELREMEINKVLL